MTDYSPIISLLTTILLLKALLSSRVGKRIQDIPNERSLHAAPVPRVGGIAVMGGILAGGIGLSVPWWIWLSAAALFLVSLVDDMRGLPVRVRFAAHLGAACAMALFSNIPTAWAILPLVLATVWLINLYNFMDGSDGLAGGMALVGFGAYGVAAMLHHDANFAMFNFAVAAAATGFLFYNFHPARVFMGDAGSVPLGFLAACLGLVGWQHGDWPAWFPLMVFSPFVVDATVTLMKRIIRREKVWQAHRQHYYQRLIQMGFGHRNTALVEYALMLCAALTALAGLFQSGSVQLTLLLAWGAIYLLLMRRIDRLWNAFSRNQDTANHAEPQP